LLRHLLFDEVVPFDKDRARRSLKVLAADLRRQLADVATIVEAFDSAPGTPPLTVQRADGFAITIDLHSPIAPGVAVMGSTADLLVDDLRVRRHLGEEVERVSKALLTK